MKTTILYQNLKILLDQKIEKLENFKIKNNLIKDKAELNFNNKKELYSKELQIFKLQKKLQNYLNKIDQDILKIKAKLLQNEAVILNFKNIIENKNNLQKYEQEIKNIILEIKENKSKIKILKKEKKPFSAFYKVNSKHKKEIKKIKKNIKISKNSNFSKSNLKIKNLQAKNNKLDINLKVKNDDLEKFIKLIKKAQNSLIKKEKKDDKNLAFVVRNLDAYYGTKKALFNINIEIPRNKIIAVIGPSGCGKSTFLRTLNRINDEITNFKSRGEILLNGEYDIYKLQSIINKYDKIELTELRTRVGMIFQKPNPFPISIYKNVSYGPKINGIKKKFLLNQIVQDSLEKSALWDEVKDNLKENGTSLSGGQQQRLCIARSIANNPEILLMDEPTSALDPIASAKIEKLLLDLKKDYTIIMVTHSMQQAIRISDYTAFFYQGKLIEFNTTEKLFKNPMQKRTSDYVMGKFG
ncbi:MAG: hypothetical protein HPPSJP_0590 [Candidatus Hepatoplasma scabrum]|nr:MAG: hypothetical protein HPPSJP_0590 [Candidatus Hepatoplasma sp.]